MSGEIYLQASDVPTFKGVLQLLERLAKKNRSALVLDEFHYLLELDSSLSVDGLLSLP